MENKLTSEQEKKIGALREEIHALQKQANSKEAEINHILLEVSLDFKDSYVEFFSGDEYVFMKVERQIIRDAGAQISLAGPAILLDTDLVGKNRGEEINSGIYEEEYAFAFSPKILLGVDFKWIRKITQDEMSLVLDYYMNTMKKNLI